MPAARAINADPRRKAQLAKIHMAKKELAIEDGAYRAMLTRLTGHESSAKASAAQLDAVIAELQVKGWKPKPGTAQRGVKRADHPSAKKARALWISLHELGAVRNGSEQALEAFAARQLGVTRLQWADQGLVYKLIEALKRMAERAGWSQDLAGVAPAQHTVVLKARLEVLLAARRPG